MNNIEKIQLKLKDNTIVYKFARKMYQPLKNINNYKRKRNLLKNGYKILDDVNILLNSSDMNAFCAYGTLLGFIREGGIISHDLDLDMGIIDDEYFSWDKLDSLMHKIGFEVKRYFMYKGCISEKTYIRDNVTIDFFKFTKKEKYMLGYIYFRDLKIPYINDNDYSVRISKVPIINKINLTRINNINVLLPENSIEFIENVYGNNWKYPDPNFKHEEEILKNEFACMYEVR